MIETNSDAPRHERIVEPEFSPEDVDLEYNLRPKMLSEYIGQDKVKENMKIYIEAAKARGESLDYVLDIIIGKGPSAQSIRIDLPHFTLVGATTRAGQLTGPLRDRFGVIERLELYTEDQLCDIIMRSSVILSIPTQKDGAMELARRSRGTPRIANRMLKRVRDFAEVMGDGKVTKELTDIALDRLEIDKLGLDSLDRRMLTMIIRGYNGGPVGLETLASALGEESVTLEDVCEPFLMQLGFLARTPRGRVATALAYRHLGLEKQGQQTFE